MNEWNFRTLLKTIMINKMVLLQFENVYKWVDVGGGDKNYHSFLWSDFIEVLFLNLKIDYFLCKKINMYSY